MSEDDYPLKPGEPGYTHPAFRKKPKPPKSWIRFKLPDQVIQKVDDLAGGKEKRSRYLRGVITKHVTDAEVPKDPDANSAWVALRRVRDQVAPAVMQYRDVLDVIMEAINCDLDYAFMIYEYLAKGKYLKNTPYGIQVYDQKIDSFQFALISMLGGRR
jgi:hypothetical protein